jgi:hypothetical protein
MVMGDDDDDGDGDDDGDDDSLSIEQSIHLPVVSIQ